MAVPSNTSPKKTSKTIFIRNKIIEIVRTKSGLKQNYFWTNAGLKEGLIRSKTGQGKHKTQTRTKLTKNKLKSKASKKQA